MPYMGSSPRMLSVLLALSLLLAGCTSWPVQEVSDARQAISAARAVGSDRYAPETLEQAERLVDQALRDLAAGDYHSARSAALTARQRAINAREASLSVQIAN